MVLRRVLLGVGLLLAQENTFLWAQNPFGQGSYNRTMPLPQPAVSPYLNLLRQGNSPAFNYLTLVRPELQTLKTLDQLNTQASQAAAAQAGTAASLNDITTGHAFGFMTQSRYFMTLGGGSSSGRSSAPVSSGQTSQGFGSMGGQVR
jgi:hypothetical protein